LRNFLNAVEAVQKQTFGQPLTDLILPKAQISLKLCSFWPACGPKTALNEDFSAFGRLIEVQGCPKNTPFWTALFISFSPLKWV
jgi:hypothetical protein